MITRPALLAVASGILCCSCVARPVRPDEAAINQWQRESAQRMSAGWQAPKWHQALGSETIEHTKQVAAACDAKIRIAVDVPEASIPSGYAGWGLQFDDGVPQQARACVLSMTHLTASVFTSAAEAAEAKAN